MTVSDGIRLVNGSHFRECVPIKYYRYGSRYDTMLYRLAQYFSTYLHYVYTMSLVVEITRVSAFIQLDDAIFKYNQWMHSGEKVFSRMATKMHYIRTFFTFMDF